VIYQYFHQLLYTPTKKLYHIPKLFSTLSCRQLSTMLSLHASAWTHIFRQYYKGVANISSYSFQDYNSFRTRLPDAAILTEAEGDVNVWQTAPPPRGVVTSIDVPVPPV